MDIHTAECGGYVYDIHALEGYAKSLPVEFVPTESFREAVGEGQTYWHDRNGVMFGPAELLRDWPAAQKNPDWRDHVEAIRRSDLSRPLWLGPDGNVFDGMHRLTRAFLDGVSHVSVRRFLHIPEWAIVDERIL